MKHNGWMGKKARFQEAAIYVLIIHAAFHKEHFVALFILPIIDYSHNAQCKNITIMLMVGLVHRIILVTEIWS